MRRVKSDVVMCNECRVPMWRQKVLGELGYTCTRCGQRFTLDELSRKPREVQAQYIQPSLLPAEDDVTFNVTT